MAKKIMQYRFFEENGNQNQPNTSYEMITKNNLINGAIFSNRTPITQLGIQTLPGTKFYLNNSVDPVEVGLPGIYGLDLRQRRTNMGFYGKVTNTSKTSFTFDRTYPNRYTMDKYAKTDGVYVGRFVLIEYDSLPIDSCILTDGVGATYRLANVDEKTFDPTHKKYYILNDDGDYVYEPFWKYVPYKDG